jgi:hypothetical protein
MSDSTSTWKLMGSYSPALREAVTQLHELENAKADSAAGLSPGDLPLRSTTESAACWGKG